MEIYVVPSILALALNLKLLIVFSGRRSFRTASPYLWFFFAGLFGMNANELFGFFYVNNADEGFVFLVGYYLSLLTAFFSSLCLAISLTKPLSRLLRLTIFCLYLFFCLITIIPDIAISGAESIGYSITRVPGPYYYVLVVGMISPITLSIAFLLFLALKTKIYDEKRRAWVLLLSYVPIFSVVLVVIPLMALGVKINASIVSSLTICISLWILIYTESKERLYKFMTFLPWTRERAFVDKMRRFLVNPELGISTAIDSLEREMIQEALDLANGNKTHAAKIVGMSRQTFDRRVKKLL